MRQMVKCALISGTALSAAMFSAPAMAQDNAQGASPPGDIIVTARRIEERLQDVPISISVQSGEQLSQRNIVTASDLAQFTPSLSANTNFGADNTTFSIRGFVQDIGTAPSVGTFFAEVVSPRGGTIGFPSGDGAGPGSFFDLQNAQVLKGPQGTLFGYNTTGGDVLLVPTKPTHRLEGYVEGSLGDYGMTRLDGVINIPVSDTFRVRLGVEHMKRDGYLHNTTTNLSVNGGIFVPPAFQPAGAPVGPSSFGNIKYTTARLSLVADLTPDLENYIIASFTDSRSNGNVQKLVAYAPFAFGSFGQAQLVSQAYHADGFYDVRSDVTDPNQHNRTWQVINTTTWKAADNLTVKNIVSYAELEQWTKMPQFGTDFQLGGGDALYVAAIENAPGFPNAHEATITEEFQLQGSLFDNRLTYQGGVYYEASNPLGTSAVENATLLDCIGSVQAGYCGYGPVPGLIDYHTSRTSTSDIGIYTQANYAITNQLKLTAGVRYTKDKAKDTAYLAGYAMPASSNPAAPGGINLNAPHLCLRSTDVATGCVGTVQQNSDAPTWLLNLDYKPVHGVLLYAKWARGYRTGGVYPSAPVAYQTFQPEKVDNFEVGAKTSWMGAIPGLFNIAAFYDKFSNQQLQVGFGPGINAISYPPTAAIANAGKSRIEGIEAELNLNPFKGFNIDLNYTYLDTKIQAVNWTAGALIDGGNYTAAPGPAVGSPLLMSPKSKLALTGSYTLPLDPSFGKISIGGTWTYQSSELAAYSDAGLPWFNGVTVANPTGVAHSTDLGNLPARGLLNLNFDWKSVAGRPFDLSAFVTNVTGKQYYTFMGGLLGYGIETASVGEPRMYGVRVKAHF
jgi:iron complex outermembrane receptor protein